MNTPLLSVCLITYNHEKYIRQAIEGVMMQKTDFDWDLIIADDFSTDGTREILKEYQQKYPKSIKLILQEKNVGPAKNWYDLITAPKSEYIAYFEGDDYWIDEFKLQKQVDFLQEHKSFALCHGDVVTVDGFGKLSPQHHFKSWNYKNNHLDYRFCIFSPIAFSATSVFRNIIPPEKLSVSIKAGDWMLWVLLTLQGDAKFIDEKLSAYRISSGISSYSIWYTDFHLRSFFLIRQLSFKKTFKKNKWLLKGAFYFILIQLSEVLKINKLSQIAGKLKYTA